ncbi:uncharacterized protein [Rutidosis leptorrhynchoides]|uniref:uncharacterized protein n=1 Tax=Rutidosis leptorrhynchoides TaxID=125765 RepID=UPI003A98E1D5
MGFRVKWRKWILACLNSASISILVNGSPTDEFSLGRGVRQGDPLSPFLFIIAAEGLNYLTKKAITSGLFKGVEIGSNKVLISLLQYADDTIFLGEWSKHNFGNLMKLLKCFENVSGLRINYHKSSLFGLGVVKGEVEIMANKVTTEKSWAWILQALSSRPLETEKDSWLFSVPINEKYKRLFHLESNQMAMVRDRDRIRDSWIWGLASDGKFTTKQLSRIIDDKRLEINSGEETLVNHLVPIKGTNLHMEGSKKADSGSYRTRQKRY